MLASPAWGARLEFVVGVPPIDGGGGDALKVERAGILLSELALRTPGGKWIETPGWVAYLDALNASQTAQVVGVSPGEYSGIRFEIGLPDLVNASDPSRFLPGHPLHPDTGGMHWSWQEGYIFAALEGRVADGGAAFAFHLGNAGNQVPVQLLEDFSVGNTDLAIVLDLDLSVALGEGVDLLNGPFATHSRDGDPLAAALRRNLARSFSIRSIEGAAGRSEPVLPPSYPPGTDPWPLAIPEHFPRPATSADNPPTLQGVALGRSLFSDDRLSLGRGISCGSCHAAASGFADPGRRVSFGVEGRPGVRNAMGLTNLLWGKRYFWDGRAGSLRDQVLLPISDHREMDADPAAVADLLSEDRSMTDRFAAAFGSPGITPERLAMALEQFLVTLVSADSRFDRAFLGGEPLSALEQRGRELFNTEFDPERGLRGADCFHCHGEPTFTNHGFANNGLDAVPVDPGFGGVSSRREDHGKFKVPSLRNVALTAPYMHDGRFDTLEEVVDHYATGIAQSPTLDPNIAKHAGRPLALSAGDKRALVAFLQALTDDPAAPTDSPSGFRESAQR